MKRVELFARRWGRRPSSVDESRDVVETRISITLHLHDRYKYSAHRSICVLLSKPPWCFHEVFSVLQVRKGDLRRETLIPMVPARDLSLGRLTFKGSQT